MDFYSLTLEDLPQDLRDRIRVVDDFEALNRLAAREFADLLAEKAAAGETVTAICPVGPVDYSYFADEINERGLSCRHLRTVNVDEYLDEDGKLIPLTHPLSFRRFMEEKFFSRLPEDKRPLPENTIFPDPAAPHKVTELIDEVGGADIVWSGFGITGHIAFNDPPAMVGEPTDLESFRACKTRILTTSDMSNAQMAIGGTHGNLEIIPKRCITIGIYELLKTKIFQLTFMRNWHAGLWRRALLGPITTAFPGSLLQEHPNVKILMTKLAAAVPVANTQQDTGEGGA